MLQGVPPVSEAVTGQPPSAPHALHPARPSCTDAATKTLLQPHCHSQNSAPLQPTRPHFPSSSSCQFNFQPTGRVILSNTRPQPSSLSFSSSFGCLWDQVPTALALRNLCPLSSPVPWPHPLRACPLQPASARAVPLPGEPSLP